MFSGFIQIHFVIVIVIVIRRTDWLLKWAYIDVQKLLRGD